MVLELCVKLGLNIYYSHSDRRPIVPDIHLMTSLEFPSGFDFWSRGHLRMAVMDLVIKFGADFQSGVIDIFPKLKITAAAIFSGYENLAIPTC